MRGVGEGRDYASCSQARRRLHMVCGYWPFIVTLPFDVYYLGGGLIVSGSEKPAEEEISDIALYN